MDACLPYARPMAAHRPTALLCSTRCPADCPGPLNNHVPLNPLPPCPGGPARVRPDPARRHCGRDRHPADLQLPGEGGPTAGEGRETWGRGVSTLACRCGCHPAHRTDEHMRIAPSNGRSSCACACSLPPIRFFQVQEFVHVGVNILQWRPTFNCLLFTCNQCGFFTAGVHSRGLLHGHQTDS